LLYFIIILVNNAKIASYLLFKIASFSISGNGMILTDLMHNPKLSGQSFINFHKQCVTCDSVNFIYNNILSHNLQSMEEVNRNLSFLL